MATTTETQTTPTVAVRGALGVAAKLNYVDLSQLGHGHAWIPGSAGSFHRKHDVQEVYVRDARGSSEESFELDKHGFAFAAFPESKVDMQDNKQIEAVVYPEVIDLLKKRTGATRVHPFSNIVRVQKWQDAMDKANNAKSADEHIKVPAPAMFVHVDHSYDGAPEVLRDNTSAEDFEKLSKTRWAIINVWRPFDHVATRDPLAVCDASSVPDSDLVGYRAHIKGNKGGSAYSNVSAGSGFETWHAKYSPKHQWHYMSDMTPDEAILIKIFDSKKDGRARRSLHSAFQTEKDHGPARNSMEVRCLVFWEDEEVE